MLKSLNVPRSRPPARTRLFQNTLPSIFPYNPSFSFVVAFAISCIPSGSFTSANWILTSFNRFGPKSYHAPPLVLKTAILGPTCPFIYWKSPSYFVGSGFSAQIRNFSPSGKFTSASNCAVEPSALINGFIIIWNDPSAPVTVEYTGEAEPSLSNH